jgi:hypothetical protein
MNDTVYLLSGIIPVTQLLGVYESFNEAYDALQAYFDKTLDEDGAGKYLYQFDKYLIESREVGRPAYNQQRTWYVEYQADYAAGTCKEVLED